MRPKVRITLFRSPKEKNPTAFDRLEDDLPAILRLLFEGPLDFFKQQDRCAEDRRADEAIRYGDNLVFLVRYLHDSLWSV